MKVPPIFEQQKQPGQAGYLQYLSQVLMRMWGQMAKVVNGGIEVYQAVDKPGTPTNPIKVGNIKGFIYRGTLFAGANTVTHNLGYQPQGFLTISVSAAANLWWGNATNTTAIISTSANVSALLLIV